MKKGISSVLFFFTCLATGWAQQSETPVQETLLSGEVSHSYYVAPLLQLTHWQDRSGVMIGGKGAWMMNQKFGLGLAGFGLMSKNSIGEIDQSNNAFLQAGYGGVLLEYIPHPERLVHFSFPLVVGMGGAAYTNNAMGRNNTGSYSYEVYDTDTFFVLEPGLQAELNLARFMRLGLAFTYRFAKGVNLPVSTDKDMSAPSFSLIVKFGKF
jgi:hypothetical protein